MKNTKRLFFGIEVHAPWPQTFPEGRMIEESQRHFTLSFLGQIEYEPLHQILDSNPIKAEKIGSCGYFDKCLPLPPSRPNVVAWHATCQRTSSLFTQQKRLDEWLAEHHYSLDNRPWLPHLTLCRKPFHINDWIKAFSPLPFYTSTIHLYESQGNLSYIPLWSHPLQIPFEEISHTADLAFFVYGESLDALYYNAFTALAFTQPSLLNAFQAISSIRSIDDIVMGLNQSIGLADRTIGSAFKAVSFHGDIIRLENELLKWEMIVDV